MNQGQAELSYVCRHGLREADQCRGIRRRTAQDRLLPFQDALLEIRRQLEFAGGGLGDEEFGYLTRETCVGLGEKLAALAQKNSASIGLTIAERLLQESAGQPLITNLFRDYLKRIGELLELVRFILKSHGETSLTRWRARCDPAVDAHN